MGKVLLGSFFILAMAIVIESCGKEVDTTREYYKYIYVAEKNILQKDYKKASACYDSAFYTGFHPFATDIYNNAVCAKYNHDDIAMLEMAVRLVLKGADMQYFDTTEIFKEFKSTGEYRQLKEMFGMLKQQRLKLIDTALINRIQAFIDRDQAVHCFLPQNAKDVAFVDSMHRLDDSLSESLKELMLAHDYLSEDMIGADFNKRRLAFQPLYGTLVLHQFQKDGKMLKTVIDSAIRKGKVKTETGLTWIDNSSGMPHIIFTGDYSVVNDTLWMTNLKDEVQTKMIVRLLKYTDANTAKLRKYYYMDEPGNVVEKLKYNYHRYLNWKKGNTTEEFKIDIGLSISERYPDFDKYHVMVDAGN